MIDFIQESGRGGRGGELVDSVMIIEEAEVERRLSSGSGSSSSSSSSDTVACTESIDR